MKTRGWYGRAAVYGGVGILVGLVLAAAVGPVIKAGRFVRWHRLSSPPVKLVALAACDDQRVYARTSSDTIYRCSSWDDSCWIRDEIPSSLRQSEFQLAGYRIEMTRPCNYSSSEFSWTVNAPPHRADCIQGTWINVDYGAEFACVLTADNKVWTWANGWSALGDRLLALRRCLGLSCIGGIAGLILGIKRSQRRSSGELRER